VAFQALLRTDPLQTLVIGGFVPGLSMLDIELLRDGSLPRNAREAVQRVDGRVDRPARRQHTGREAAFDLSGCGTSKERSISSKTGLRGQLEWAG
jgi:hypothetical protein